VGNNLTTITKKTNHSQERRKRGTQWGLCEKCWFWGLSIKDRNFKKGEEVKNGNKKEFWKGPCSALSPLWRAEGEKPMFPMCWKEE